MRKKCQKEAINFTNEQIYRGDNNFKMVAFCTMICCEQAKIVYPGGAFVKKNEEYSKLSFLIV